MYEIRRFGRVSETRKSSIKHDRFCEDAHCPVEGYKLTHEPTLPPHVILPFTGLSKFRSAVTHSNPMFVAPLARILVVHRDRLQ